MTAVGLGGRAEDDAVLVRLLRTLDDLRSLRDRTNPKRPANKAYAHVVHAVSSLRRVQGDLVDDIVRRRSGVTGPDQSVDGPASAGRRP